MCLFSRHPPIFSEGKDRIKLLQFSPRQVGAKLKPSEFHHLILLSQCHQIVCSLYSYACFSTFVSNLWSIFSIIDSGITAALKFTSSWRELYRQIAFELLHFLQLCSTIPSSSRFMTKWWSGPRSISLVCIAMNCPNLCQSTSISNSLSDISNVTILATQDFKCYDKSAICWCFAI